MHALQIVSEFSAHENSAIKSMAVISDGPQLITGGSDNTLKVWNFSTGKPELSTTLATPGPVHYLYIKDNSTVVYSDDENTTTDPKNTTLVGVIRILNPSDGSVIILKVSLYILIYINYPYALLCLSIYTEI